MGKAPATGTEPALGVTTPLATPPAARLPGLVVAGAVALVPGSAADVSPLRSELWAIRLMASANLGDLGSQR